SKADVGIDELDSANLKVDFLVESPKDEADEELRRKKIVVSKRKKFDDKLKSVGLAEFTFSMQESEGTKKMFEISPFVYQSLKDGTTLVIDEFDSRFHPLLTRKIVELFNSSVNTRSQFVFVTHDT